MKVNILAILCAFLMVSCDDGDIILTSFDFEEENLQNCGGPGGYLFFNLNGANTESLTLRLGTTDELFTTSDTLVTNLDGNTNFVNYRIFNSEVTSDYFCNEVPPTSPEVDIEYLANSGVATLITTSIFSDNDNLSVEDEGTTADTDMDGLLDFYDFDDDGDNVPTLLELDTENADKDNNPLTNPKDTDGDSIPDYLDNDDDGDGVLTIDEDSNMNLDPTDDVTDVNVGADYLNPAVSNTTDINEYREHTYDFQSSVVIILNNLVLTDGNEQITRETFNMGNIDNIAVGTVIITPVFTGN
ncbi:MAG: hypothetical protein HKN48_13440 [Flavobacteriaceae bacterium]|nr:hypothetical protein [Flavobacteriaceae bacterium]